MLFECGIVSAIVYDGSQSTQDVCRDAWEEPVCLFLRR